MLSQSKTEVLLFQSRWRLDEITVLLRFKHKGIGNRVKVKLSMFN
jgi:hypothetical protein